MHSSNNNLVLLYSASIVLSYLYDKILQIPFFMYRPRALNSLHVTNTQ